MSLLMEALKRAERQKRDIETGSGSQEEYTGLPADLASSPVSAFPTSSDQPLPDLKWIEPPVSEKVQLPIEAEESLALELLATEPKPAIVEDPPPEAADEKAEADFFEKPQSSAQAAEPAVSAAEPDPVEAVVPATREAAAEPEKLGLDQRRQQAANVFSAARPRSPDNHLLLALGAVAGLALLGGGAYLYWLSAENAPTPQAVSAPPAIAVSVPAPVPPPAPMAQQPAEPVVPATIEAGESPGKPETVAAPPRTVAPEPAEKHGEKHAINIRPGSQKESIMPVLSRAYSAFMAGNDSQAQQDYSIALRQDANNRDALLGMAAIATKRGQNDVAVGIYQRLLDLDPRDPAAQSGMLALNAGQSDPIQSESRIKTLLSQQPDAHFLYFTLGNLYAGQSRWAEAQQAFFNAHQRDSGNPDYLYNLAISLEHLSQGKIALEYYQRALARSRTTPANFDKASAQSRIKELQPTADK